MMDKRNLFQLAFYGDLRRICDVLAGEDGFGDGLELGGDDEGGDGHNRGAGGGSAGARSSPGRGQAEDNKARLANMRGGAHYERGRGTSYSYLLREEKTPGGEPPVWRLRLVQGLPDATYEEFKATPLHFSCAAKHREGIIALLQAGAKDQTANFYQHASLSCYEMLVGAAKLQTVFDYWARGPSAKVWTPKNHDMFPTRFKAAVRATVLALSVDTAADDKRCLFHDLLISVIGWVPTDVVTLAQWWPSSRHATDAAVGARKRQRSPNSS